MVSGARVSGLRYVVSFTALAARRR